MAIKTSAREEAPVTADAAWEALNEALEDCVPPCAGRALFTADGLTPEQRALCASICATCPVADLCDAYAAAAKIASGFWAGRSYPPRGKK